MMRTLILVIVGIALLSAAPASAEDKIITGTVTCTMATEADAVSDKIVFDWDCIDRVAAEKPNERNGWDRAYANLLKQAREAGESSFSRKRSR